MHRREFLSLAAAVPAAGRIRLPRERRNVLLVIADDQGLEAAGCYGHPAVQTPHLDELAAGAARFTHAFASVASCSPSRGVILTGLHQHSNGQYGLAHGIHNQVTGPWVTSLPARLRQAGFRTGVLGKDHVMPRERYPFEWRGTGGFEGNRSVARMADAAGAFFRGADARPFFLLVGYSDPHRAGDGFANREYPGVTARPYRAAEVEVPPFLPDIPEVRRELAEYYQSVARLDQGLGLLLRELERAGRRDDTLLVYLSDNGMPFPGAKTTLYDAGIHLPLVVRVPGARGGVVSDALASWTDIAPTVLAWAGLTAEDLQGRSLLPFVQGEPADARDAVHGSHTMHEITMYYPMRAIRTRRHKLLWNLAAALPYPSAADLWASATWQAVKDDPGARLGVRTVDAYVHRPEWELYDLATDPHESRNLATDPAHAPLVGELRGRLQAFMHETRDPWIVPATRDTEPPSARR